MESVCRNIHRTHLIISWIRLSKGSRFVSRADIQSNMTSVGLLNALKPRSSGLWRRLVLRYDTNVSADLSQGGLKMKMKVAKPSEALVSRHITVRRHNSEDLKSLTIKWLLGKDVQQYFVSWGWPYWRSVSCLPRLLLPFYYS